MKRLNSAMSVVPAHEDEPGTPEIDYIRWMQQMQTDLAESINGVMLRGARPVPIGTAAGGTALPTTSAGRLVGWSLRENAAVPAACTVRFYNGRNAADGVLLATVCVAASPAAASCQTIWLGSGVSITDALYVDITGSVEGCVYLGAAE